MHYTELLEQLRQDSELKSRFVSSTLSESKFRNFDEVVEQAIRFITKSTIAHYSENNIPKPMKEPFKEDEKYSSFRAVFELYLGLGKINNPSKPFLPVFTTNYDMLVEDLFAQFNMNNDFPLVNGFSPQTLAYHIGTTDIPCPDPAQGKDEIWDKEKYKQTDIGLHYYRLHGSVSWRAQSNAELRFRRNGLELDDQLGDICAMLPGQERMYKTDAYSFAFRRFYQTLLGCKTIIFVGFNFQDADVNHLLLTVNEHRTKPFRMIVVNPNKEQSSIIDTLKIVIENSHLPAYPPDKAQIRCLPIRFGEGESFKETILKEVNALIMEN